MMRIADATTIVCLSLAAIATASGASADSAGESSSALEEIVVIGKGYGVQVGAKSVAPLREVPNTVTVIDQQQIQEQQLFNLEDLAQQTTGLNTSGQEGALVQFVSRGFPIDNFLYDGVPLADFAGFTREVPDLFLYDRVEILRGPAGLFSGSGSPAGSINFVRKRPLPELAVTTRLTAGSWNNYRGELDVSVPISERVGLRAGAAYQDRDQFVDVTGQNRTLAFMSMDVDLGETTRLTIGGHYDEFEDTTHNGLPGAAGGGLVNLPRSTFASPKWGKSTYETKAAFVELRQQLGSRWVMRASTQYGVSDTLLYSGRSVAFNGITPADRSVLVTASGLTRDQDYFTVDLNAVGSIALFGRNHEVVVGADYQRRADDRRFTARPRLGMFDLYEVQNVPDPALPFTFGNEIAVKQQGIYGQLRYKLADPLTLVLGGRVSNYEDENTFTRPTRGPTAVVKEDGRFTPYAGVVWDFARDWSAYLSYADTFQPQALQDITGNSLPPIIGEQFEAGVKASLANDRLLLSTSVFRIEQTNRGLPDVVPGTYLASGRVENTGFEVEANGEILPGWRVNAGYAYIDVEDGAGTGASSILAIPEHNVKLWTLYQPAGGPLQRFSFGGGFNWQSETEAFLTFVGGTTGARQPAYSVVNLRLGYEISQTLSLAFNVKNVFDEKYYARISGTEFGNFYGEPTSFMITLNAGFGGDRSGRTAP